VSVYVCMCCDDKEINRQPPRDNTHVYVYTQLNNVILNYDLMKIMQEKKKKQEIAQNRGRAIAENSND